MEPIVNNNEPPKPADLNTLSNNNAGTGLGAAAVNNTPQLPNGLTAQAVTKFAKSRKTAFKKWYGPKIREMEKWHKFWRNGLPMTKGGTMVPLPIGHAILESVNARLASSLLNRPKYVEAIAELPTTDNASQKIVGDFINQTLTRLLPQPEKGKAAVKSALIESFVIVRSVWSRVVTEKIETVTEPHAITGEPVIVGEQVVPQMKEGWTIELKNPANMGWEPHTETRIQASPWTFETARMSYNDLLRWQEQGRIWNVEFLKNIIPASLGASDREDWEASLKKADGDSEWRFTYADEKMYQVDEWFADLTYDEEGQTKTVKAHFFVVENEHLIYWEENTLEPKRHPYVSCPLLIDPRSIIGVNILEPVEPLLDQINAYAQKQSVLVDFFSNPTILYDESSGLAGRATFSKVKGMVPVTNVNGVKQFTYDSSALLATEKYINFLIGLARESTGANEQFQGIDGADTATEFQGLQAAAGSRFADIADTLNQGLMEGLADEAYWMYRQFGVDGEMIVHPNSESGQAISLTRADLAGDYQFKAVSAVSENYKAKQIADDTAFLAEIGQLNATGAMGQRPYNLEKHISEVSLPLRGVKTSADMFLTVPAGPLPLANGQVGAGAAIPTGMEGEGMPIGGMDGQPPIAG